jgi:hypothetical protein
MMEAIAALRLSSGAISGASWQNGRASGLFRHDRAARFEGVTIK